MLLGKILGMYGYIFFTGCDLSDVYGTSFGFLKLLCLLHCSLVTVFRQTHRVGSFLQIFRVPNM